MISDYVRLRAVEHLAPREVERLREYLLEILTTNTRLPSRGRGLDWRGIAAHCGIDGDVMVAAANALRPGLEAMRRELQKSQARATPAPPDARLQDIEPPARPRAMPASRGTHRAAPRVEPRPRSQPAEDGGPATFHLSFEAAMQRHQETAYSLARELAAAGFGVETSTLRMWLTGQKAPTHGSSLEILSFLEKRWSLEAGYFRSRLPHPARAVRCLNKIGRAHV